ncbi:MAG: T9SS type A sorting domain-containing protein, partial [Bacteroidales bacterium]|nr:T9SS type A sorting domain-containing protein [Bacteroidales bacterium]
MKKILLISLFLIAFFASKAQSLDTLMIGERNPTYYYWDTNWLDHYFYFDMQMGSGNFMDVIGKPEFARYCNVDTSLRVIGIAALVNFVFGETDPNKPDTDPWDFYQTEYFCLYEVDSTTNEMILLDKKPLPKHPQPELYMVTCSSHPMFGRKPCATPCYALYFDSAITVYDSFYVSFTGNCNRYIPLSEGRFYHYHCSPIRTALLYADLSHGDTNAYPRPNHFKKKFHELPPAEEPLWWHDSTTDTNWHIIHCWETVSYDTFIHVENKYWMYIFPIIDTSYFQNWINCIQPTGLSTVSVTKDLSVIKWDGNSNESEWELTVTRLGEAPDTLNPIVCYNDVAILYNLDTAQWYVAQVRAVCDSSHKSPWSDTLHFYVPGDTTTTSTEAVRNDIDNYTYLAPNPAKTSVTIASSFRINKIEIYSLSGEKVFSSNIDSISAIIDISGLPKGCYLTR